MADAFPNRFPKTDRKFLNFHTATSGNPEVSELMHCDENAQRNDEGDKVPQYVGHAWRSLST
ncbi:Uncharacterised protein [Vibrio cholerae]|nr:Uncharacterised protein [Vibrio cholerae]CSA96417.1 Uncharacterised protein [Vibrio cholerae]CSB36692.1 Uncharacterised protein [Vibrio cholerae]CSB38158.1 Uncharacterised protein [Vibrio cholerae]CSB79737.1 Uncharacterised protein [Vibrio cholerae]